MLDYREFAPPPRLAESVECFWISRQDAGCATSHRVLPDGCADIVYLRGRQRATLQFVAPMTRYADVPQPAGTLSVGIRFHPAMWTETLRLDGHGLADQMVLLQDLWGPRAVELASLLDACEQPERIVQVLAHSVPSSEARSPFQRAIAALEQSHGVIASDDLASAAGLSTRQFRRRCLEATSLSPKLLSRILRFRYANARAGGMRQHHAGLAAECGYSDQSHFIAESRRFSGRTPCSPP